MSEEILGMKLMRAGLESFKAYPPERDSSLSVDEVLAAAESQARAAGA